MRRAFVGALTIFGVILLTGWRRLRPPRAAAQAPAPSAHDVPNSAELVFVITWAETSRGAGSGSFGGLAQLAAAYQTRTDVRALVDAKGSRCARMPPPLATWAATGRLHCLQGPNRAARESHTVLRFCHAFYHHLPRAVVFLQDDPDMQALQSWPEHPWVRWVGTADWASDLRASHAARRARATPPNGSW